MSKIVVIDAGHGGVDPGAGGHGLAEKDLTLDIARRIATHLERYDVKVILTRTADTFISLKDRTTTANKKGADCFVSLHINAFNETANGFESFRYLTDSAKSKSYALQNKIHDKVSPLWVAKGRKDRGRKKANFHVLREFKGASVLCEYGFITNAKDAKLLKSDDFLQDNAEATAEAIADYLGLKMKPSDTLYRFIVDGDQKAAYRELDNLAAAVKRQLSKSPADIRIQPIKE